MIDLSGYETIGRTTVHERRMGKKLAQAKLRCREKLVSRRLNEIVQSKSYLPELIRF